MALVFLDIDKKHFKKFEAFMGSLPEDEAYFVEAEDPEDFSESVQKMILRKIQKEFDLDEDELIDKLNEFNNLDDDDFEDEFDEDDDFENNDEYNLLDASGEVIKFEVEAMDIVGYFPDIDAALFNDDYKFVTVEFENGVVASKEFVSKRLADYLLSANSFFYEDAIVVNEISIEAMSNAIKELAERGYIEDVFEFEDEDKDEDDFEDFTKN